ncbi:MAG TPA: ABC transporter permease [Baekduia sp.]|nr:ABC transporter permease [Baekduia sp.]
MSKRPHLRVSVMLGLFRIRLRERWVPELLAVVGIACGVALLYATQVASTSLAGPVAQLNQGIVGHSQLQLLSRGAKPFPEQVYRQVIALPGVRRAAPVLQVPANLVGPAEARDVILLGADPRIVKLRGSLLKGFRSSEAAEQETVVIPAPIAKSISTRFGDDVRLQFGARTVTTPAIVGDRTQLGSLADTSIALVPLAYLQRLTRIGHNVTRILVEAEPGQVDRVRNELMRLNVGGTDVRSADFETRLFVTATKPISEASILFSVLSALVGWLFAVCALLVTANQRRQLAAQQYKQGYPRSATLRTLLVDVLAIWALGAIVGLAAGDLMSREGFRSDVSFLSGAFPIGDQRVVTWGSIALAAGGGLIATAFGVLLPVPRVVAGSLPRFLRRSRGDRDDDRHAPRGERGETVSIRLVGVGVVALAAAAAVAAFAPGLAVAGLLSLGVALVALMPVMLTATIASLGWILRNSPRAFPSALLALQRLREPELRTRAIAITTTGAVAVFGATSLQGGQANLQTALNNVVRGLDEVSPIWVAPTGAGSIYGTTTFAPGSTRRIATVSGVTSVALYRAGLLDLAGHRAWTIGLPSDVRTPIPPGQILKGDVNTANEEIRSGGWATVSHAIADGLGLDVGNRFTLASPAPISLRVAAITTNLGWSGGGVVVNAHDFARAWARPDVAAYHVRLAPGTSPSTARDQIAAALGPTAAVRVETSQQRQGRQRAASHGALSRLRQIAQLTLVAAVLAVGAAMTGLLWQHRRLVGSLKLHGARTKTMWRSMVIETVVLIGAGALPAGLFGLLGQQLCSRGMEVVTGFPMVQSLRVDVAALTVAAVVGSSMVIVAIPGYLVGRVKPGKRE